MVHATFGTGMKPVISRLSCNMMMMRTTYKQPAGGTRVPSVLFRLFCVRKIEHMRRSFPALFCRSMAQGFRAGRLFKRRHVQHPEDEIFLVGRPDDVVRQLLIILFFARRPFVVQFAREERLDLLECFALDFFWHGRWSRNNNPHHKYNHTAPQQHRRNTIHPTTTIIIIIIPQ